MFFGRIAKNLGIWKQDKKPELHTAFFVKRLKLKRVGNQRFNL